MFISLKAKCWCCFFHLFLQPGISMSQPEKRKSGQSGGEGFTATTPCSCTHPRREQYQWRIQYSIEIFILRCPLLWLQWIMLQNIPMLRSQLGSSCKGLRMEFLPTRTTPEQKCDSCCPIWILNLSLDLSCVYIIWWTGLDSAKIRPYRTFWDDDFYWSVNRGWFVWTKAISYMLAPCRVCV